MTQENEPIGQESIAVIGLAGRFPGAANVSRFWENLCSGVESVRTLSEKELIAAGASEEQMKNSDFVRRLGQLSNPGDFDAAFFGYTPREAELTDPQHRLFLECCWEALENAGYDASSYAGPISVFAGASMNHYIRNILNNPLALSRLSDLQMLIGQDKDFLTTRVSYKLNLRGPSFDIQSACSTSLVALHVACQNLLTYQCDLAITGGVSLQLPGHRGFVYSEGDIRSSKGTCRAFDHEAAGTVVGEGVGAVVLKRYSEALADRDTIYAHVLASSINNDGSHKAGYTAPSVEGQSEVIATAHALAGIEAGSIGYVETHGTGTPLGDPIEIAALTRAFRETSNARGSCAIGSVKTNVGHLDTAAGITGFIKAVLALYHKKIPPSLHFTRPNPRLNLEESPFFVCDTLREWKRESYPRRAGVSSFGVGGTNAHVVLEEAPIRNHTKCTSNFHVLPFSAKTKTALDVMTDNIRDHLTHTGQNICDIAFTLQNGRKKFSHRRFVVCPTAAEGADALQRSDPQRTGTRECDVLEAKPVLMFSGQGTQYAAMGRDLYETNQFFAGEFTKCSSLFQKEIGVDLRELLYGNTSDPSLLGETRITQPVLFTIEYSLGKLWEHYGVAPAAMIGHSIGEYAAAVLAEVFTLEQAVHVVAARGRLMQKMDPGAMLAVALSEAQLQNYLIPGVVIAAINAPEMCTVSGPFDKIDTFEHTLRSEGYEPRRLATSHAFHSPMMEPVLEEFSSYVRTARPAKPRRPFISNVTGTWITDEQATDPAYWARHVRNTVRFSQGIQTLARDLAPAVFLEVGPGATLRSLTRHCLSDISGTEQRSVFSSLRHEKQVFPDDCFLLQTAGNLWMAGVDVHWTKMCEGARPGRVPLPTYPFQRKRYWIDGTPENTRTSETTPSPATEDGIENDNNHDGTSASPEQASGSVQDTVRQLWQELLGVEEPALESDFFALGGDSVWAARLISRINQQFSLSLPVSALFQHSTLSSLIGLITEKVPEHGSAESVEIPLVDRSNYVPLSPPQQRLWFLCEITPDSRAFNLATGFDIRGKLKVDALKSAIDRVVLRHEALRSTFPRIGEVPRCRIHSNMTYPFEFLDLSEADPQQRDLRARKEVRSQSTAPYDLQTGPLLRVLLIKMDHEEHLLVIMMHHIVSDGWSMGVMLKEISSFYASDASEPFEPLTVQFPDYAAWYRSWSENAEMEQHVDYWKEELRGYSGVLELPTDKPRPPELSYTGFQHDFTIDPETSHQVHQIADRCKTTVFGVLLAAFYAVLQRYSSEKDIVIGTPFANRHHPATEPLIGFFLNMLPLRVAAEENISFSDLVGIAKDRIVSAFQHSDLPFGQLIEAIKPPRDLSRPPLFQVMFAFQNFPMQKVSVDSLDISPRLVERGATEYDLSLYMWEADDCLQGTLEASEDLFEQRTIAAFASHFSTLLSDGVRLPDTPVSGLRILTQEDERLVRDDLNATSVDFEAASMEELFRRATEQDTSACAVIDHDEMTSYGEVDRLSNQCAHFLQEKGVGKGSLVGICLERNLDMVVAVLGVLKAGGAYVPLDPAYPIERLRYMTSDAELGLILTHEKLSDLFSDSPEKTIKYENIAESLDSFESTPPEVTATGEDLAYVIYTSGSTGKPKGVQVPRRALVNFVSSMAREPGLTPQDRVMAVTTLSFDISVLEIILPLTVGATVILAGQNDVRDGKRLLTLLAEHRATLMQATPSAWRLMLSAGWEKTPGLRALCGGEPMPRDLAGEILERTNELWNMYGPTETTVWSTCYRVTDPSAPLLIGKPIANTRVYVVDRNMNLTPPGVPGELLIGGGGVTLGYRNRPDLTDRQFIFDHICKETGSKLYRTGDLVRRRIDGNLEYLNRIDSQVKVRGFRIELGEIETVLKQHPQVQACAVICKEMAAGDIRLIAYFVPAEGKHPTPTELRAHLRNQLPRYMLPQHFAEISQLPLTPAGKVDRKSLPDLFGQQLQKGAGSEPSTESQKLLAEVWKDLLRVDSIGLHDNFFDLGGHSLLVMELIGSMKRKYNVDLTPRVFLTGTLEQIAATCAAQIDHALAQESHDQKNEQNAEETRGKVPNRLQSFLRSTFRRDKGT